MDAVNIGAASLAGNPDASALPETAPQADRFAAWGAFPARLALITFVILLFLAAIVPVNDPNGEQEIDSVLANGQPIVGADERDRDLAMYEAVISKVQAGEKYYEFIVPEHRARDYSVRPSFNARLPTLSHIQAVLNTLHLDLVVPAIVLGCTIIAWWLRLRDEPGVGNLRRVATAMVFLASSLLLSRYYYTLHELWSGALMMLALGLHRVRAQGQPGRWGGALVCAALALFIRETTLPFVLLMAATALYYRNWREATAWLALIVVFVIALTVHLNLITPQVLLSDRTGPSWIALRGMSGWIGNMVQASNLRFLPHWVAGPLVMVTLLGWASWRSPLGTFAFFIGVGYGVLFMVVSRWNNFYWGALVAPLLTPGLVFAPRGFVSLLKAARGRDSAEGVRGSATLA